jgi:hypothetical protein
VIPAAEITTMRRVLLEAEMTVIKWCQSLMRLLVQSWSLGREGKPRKGRNDHRKGAVWVATAARRRGQALCHFKELEDTDWPPIGKNAYSIRTGGKIDCLQ